MLDEPKVRQLGHASSIYLKARFNEIESQIIFGLHQDARLLYTKRDQEEKRESERSF